MLIHRLWLGDRPGPFEPALGDLIRLLHPGAVLNDHSRVPVEVADLANLSVDPRHQANVSRYWLLYTYGGLWLDHDVIPLRDLRPLCGPSPFTAGWGELVEGGVMWFPEPGHPALKEVLRRCETPAVSHHPVWMSGARVLAEVLPRFGVAVNPQVVGLDAVGRPVCEEPWAVHLWCSTRRTRR